MTLQTCAGELCTKRLVASQDIGELQLKEDTTKNGWFNHIIYTSTTNFAHSLSFLVSMMPFNMVSPDFLIDSGISKMMLSSSHNIWKTKESIG